MTTLKVRIRALNAFALNYHICLDIVNRNGIAANCLFTGVLNGGGAGNRTPDTTDMSRML